MIADTSSNPRREWYEEEYQPDEPPLFQGIGPLRITPLGSPKVGDNFRDENGFPIGVITSIDPTNGSVTVNTRRPALWPACRRSGPRAGIFLFNPSTIRPLSEVKVFAEKFLGISMPEPEPIPAYESVRDRALRLKQQPHWQAEHPSDFHFDHRGRRRY